MGLPVSRRPSSVVGSRAKVNIGNIILRSPRRWRFIRTSHGLQNTGSWTLSLIIVSPIVVKGFRFMTSALVGSGPMCRLPSTMVRSIMLDNMICGDAGMFI
jgi:hypothetical protein